MHRKGNNIPLKDNQKSGGPLSVMTNIQMWFSDSPFNNRKKKKPLYCGA